MVVATGFFDGVHLGHRFLIDRLIGEAHRRGTQSLIVTFWPHPRNVLQNEARDFRLLSSMQEKKALLMEMGVDRVEVLEFSRAFSSLTMRAGDYQYLVFTLSNGTTQAVTATDLSITFTSDNLVATSGNETLATLPLSTLTSMEFSNNGTSGIESVSVNQLTTDSNTVIYDLNGRQMPKDTTLPKGVYILKNSNKTIKVNIR